jgi:signal transduction histidine kinase
VGGMIKLPSVVRVVVKESSTETEAHDDAVIIELGKLPETAFLQKTFPININHNGESMKIGSLTIFISLDILYQDLYGTVVFILIFQMLKTFLMSAFILGIFHYLVTRHLFSMSEFANKTSNENLDEYLVLDRKSESVNDEISSMLNAINTTKRNLKKLVKTSEDSVKMKIEITQREETEKAQNLFKQQIETKNSNLALSNTKLEKTIQELKNTQDKLVNAEKMAALGGMVQGVAHELNTPIGLSITGASHIKSDTIRITKLLSHNEMKKSDLDDYLESAGNLTKSICVSLDQAAKLIRSFKLVSVEQHIEAQQVFNVRSNLADILYSINPSIKRHNIKVVNQVPDNILINSFPGVFYQIYTNLINNALLHAFENYAEGEVVINAKFENNILHLLVKDNGGGMSEEVLNKVFDPFFTTKRARGGTGLGMNIIYNLVNEKLLGSIEVRSELRKGTTFELFIPSLDVQELRSN